MDTGTSILLMGATTFYVLSLRRSRYSGVMVWWGAEDRGYSTSLVHAGVYTASQLREEPDYYNNGVTTLAVPCEVANAMVERAVATDTITLAAMREASAAALAKATSEFVASAAVAQQEVA